MGDGAEGFPTAVLSQIFCSQILAKQQSEARVLVSFEKKKKGQGCIVEVLVRGLILISNK